jgi:transcriptional regulator with XRE-family HTH domain
MYNRQEIANRIYIARKNKDLKQREVCAVLKINQSSYSALELGKRTMTVEELFILSELFNVSIQWLLCIESIAELTDSERLEVDKFINYIIGIRGK